MSSFGDRMKNYEKVSAGHLVQRLPVIIRIDGKAFHTYTRGMDSPFDEDFHTAMVETAKYLCENIQGCRIAYTQSDEISLLLTDYRTIRTEGWFDYNIQKMVSVSASYATAKFNSFRDKLNADRYAQFDSRVFNLPKSDVCNYFLWRQVDAKRNSIQGLARDYFSHNSLHGKSQSQMQEMLFSEYGINWNNIDVWKKRGSCIKKVEVDKEQSEIYRTEWEEDESIPIFSKDRDYINKHVYIRED